jgi:16S rRNA (adenine1518-N6/adenine1519-N6)-dimethyltransferase
MAIEDLTREDIVAIAESVDLQPYSALGQYFLHDAEVARWIVSTCEVRHREHVLEVGAGMGALTLALLASGATVTAVESNEQMARQLPKSIANRSHSEIERLFVMNTDAREVRRTDLNEEPSVVVASLPTAVTVEAFLHLLAEFPSVHRVVAVVDSAVITQLAAKPSAPDYDVGAAKLRYLTDVRVHGDVRPSAFWPEPALARSVVRLDRID